MVKNVTLHQNGTLYHLVGYGKVTGNKYKTVVTYKVHGGNMTRRLHPVKGHDRNPVETNHFTGYKNHLNYNMMYSSCFTTFATMDSLLKRDVRVWSYDRPIQWKSDVKDDNTE